jgi:RNA polymerase sigma factor (sigma-70 family)
MTNADHASVAQYLRQVVGQPCAGDTPDAELLDRFLAQRDASAFETLVWRHGPKVLGLCRRVLHHEQDAEDAFQAVFLVLVRKARSIGKRQAVGPWLYRVAFRIALRAKMRADRRAVCGAPLQDVAAAEQTPELVWRDLRLVLDEEVNRLPAKYRDAFVLCYLDGKTNEEAARELGCPRGTILSRLAWARERLRARLSRRGLALSAGLLATHLTAHASEAIAPALVESARQAMCGMVSAGAASLAKGALHAMVWNKSVMVTACVLVLAALGIGGAMVGQTLGARSAAGQAAPPPEDKPATPPAKDKEKRFTLELRDQPWNKVFEWYAEVSGLTYVGQEKLPGTLTLIPPDRKRQYTLDEVTELLNEALFVRKYILVRRTTSFTVLPADEKIDPTFLPRVRLEDLEKRGRTELVTVLLPLTTLKARDIGPEVKKMIGPFGEVIILDKGNQLILLDTAGNLSLVVQTVKEMEMRETDKKK